jgi:flagellar biosynthesis protein FlhB
MKILKRNFCSSQILYLLGFLTVLVVLAVLFNNFINLFEHHLQEQGITDPMERTTLIQSVLDIVQFIFQIIFEIVCLIFE